MYVFLYLYNSTLKIFIVPSTAGLITLLNNLGPNVNNACFKFMPTATVFMLDWFAEIESILEPTRCNFKVFTVIVPQVLINHVASSCTRFDTYIPT